MGDEPKNGVWTFLMMLLDLLRESVVVSGLVALAMVFVACYLWVTGQVVPEPLFVLLGTVVGFFFGAKAGTTSTHNQYAKMAELVSGAYTQNRKDPMSGSGDYQQRGQR